MQTGQVAQTLEGPHPVFVFIWVIILFLGHQKGRLRFLDLRPKQNTGRWLMLLLKLFGFANYLWNFSVLFSMPPLSTATTSRLFTWLLILCSIDVPSTSRSIFILFAKRSLLVKFVFYTFQQALSLQIFLPKDFIHRPSSTFAPVSTAWRLMMTLRGGIRESSLRLYWFCNRLGLHS